MTYMTWDLFVTASFSKFWYVLVLPEGKYIVVDDQAGDLVDSDFCFTCELDEVWMQRTQEEQQRYSRADGPYLETVFE